MKILCLLISVFSYTSISAQNLITNPGFDINTGCPTQIGQINRADGWSVWGGTPDYFHSCSNITHPYYGTPLNGRGYQMPLSGDAYIGLFTYSAFTPNLREFVGRALSSPLVPGQTYYVSFWVNRADSSLLSHATNNIGIRFASSPQTLVNPDTALNNAHVFESSVINDTASWTQVSGTYVADSAYTFIGIGNYFSDSATVIISGASNSNYAYYLIEDVCVSIDPVECGINTGVESYQLPFSRMFYPNPANEYFILDADIDMKGIIELYDLFGRRVLEENFSLRFGESRKIDISSLAPGMFLVNFVGGRDHFTGKLLISRSYK